MGHGGSSTCTRTAVQHVHTGTVDSRRMCDHIDVIMPKNCQRIYSARSYIRETGVSFAEPRRFFVGEVFSLSMTRSQRRSSTGAPAARGPGQVEGILNDNIDVSLCIRNVVDCLPGSFCGRAPSCDTRHEAASKFSKYLSKNNDRDLIKMKAHMNACASGTLVGSVVAEILLLINDCIEQCQTILQTVHPAMTQHGADIQYYAHHDSAGITGISFHFVRNLKQNEHLSSQHVPFS